MSRIHKTSSDIEAAVQDGWKRVRQLRSFLPNYSSRIRDTEIPMPARRTNIGYSQYGLRRSDSSASTTTLTGGT